MAKVLIVYATKHGQTKKIANFIANEMKTLGHSVQVSHCDSRREFLPIRAYDMVIVGGPVYAHGFPHNLLRWTKTHADGLKLKPTSFFSVCLGILQKDAKVQQEEKRLVEEFFVKSGWYPDHWTIFAGALPFTQYNWFVRSVMKRISATAGGDTDTRRDFEYTDWDLVRNFADQSAAMVPQGGEPYERRN